MVRTASTGLVAGLFACLATVAAAQDCAAGKTLEDGRLTVATGNPAYFPWVIDDSPEAGQGFEAAVAYAVAEEMGFAADAVVWTRASFDESIQPGAKNFDVNLQQFSITPERDRIVDFSEPYYRAAMAVLTRQGLADTPATVDGLRGLKWGGVATTTAMPVLMGVIDPEEDPLLYDDNADVVEAMKANQIDAALFDLPTALYLSAVTLDDGLVLGQFPADRTEAPDAFGMLMEEGNPLKECVDAAIGTLQASGRLAEIEDEWLSQATDVPVIE